MDTQAHTTTARVADESWHLKVGWSVYIGVAILYVVFSNWGLSRLVPWASSLEILAIPLVPIGIVLGSILVHELGHAATMEIFGMPVKRIGLEIWGGYTEPQDDVSIFQVPAGRYFWTTFMGPAVNLLVAFFAWYVILGAPSIAETRSMMASPHSLTEFFAAWTVLMNLLLGASNLLPVFPLDGGHVFRSIVMVIFGGTVLPTLIAGGVSLAAGSFGLWWTVEAVRSSGLAGLGTSWMVGLYAAVVVFGSVQALSTVFEREAAY